MRLLTCSNSSPAALRTADDALRPDGAGGLVPHLTSLLTAMEGHWVFADAKPSAAHWPYWAGDVRLHPVPVERAERVAHYEIVSIEVLQRMFHYLHNTETGPSFDADLHRAWGVYRTVNRRFADTVATIRPAPDAQTVVLVNDYHLLLVPGMIRAFLGDDIQIVYSHGVPWCEPQYFGTLPETVRVEILNSLLNCDVVVFHSTDWRSGFAQCCARFLPEAEVSPVRVQHRGRATQLAVVPFPLDGEAVTSLAASNVVGDWAARLARQAAGRQLLARVDRLDLWKNHLRGFAAHAALLKRKPSLVDEVWFLAVMTLPRYRSIRHLHYEEACRTAVHELNTAYRRPGGPDVATLLKIENTAEARVPAIAALSQAATVLINPTYEGFSMVAKEAVLLSGTSTVLLSRTAGAYEQLAPITVPVEPFDVTQTADALEQALAGESASDQAGRASWRRRISTERALDWLSSVLGECDTGRPDIDLAGSKDRQEAGP